jgi:lipopolysaccharide transport system permease protein
MPVQSSLRELKEALSDPLSSMPQAGAASGGALTSPREIVLRPRKGWESFDLEELWRARELFAFLVWRDISIKYKQTFLGGLWAILQPLLAMLIFTVFFNRLAGIQGDGVPYPLFAYSGLVLWTFFSNSITTSSNSLVGNQMLVSKVYFPRIFIPLASIGAVVLDLLIGFLLLLPMMYFYKWPFSVRILCLPLFVIGTVLAGGGIGLLLSALNVRFRDVKYVVPYFTQIGLFISPVIYPLRYVPERYRLLLGLNPMTGMISGFRSSLLGQKVNWELVWTSLAVSVALFLAGLFVFRRMERRFADII